MEIDENLSSAACVLNGQHTFLEVAVFASSEEQEGTMCEGGVLFTSYCRNV